MPSRLLSRLPARPRVLLLAHACSPARGSEEKVGWNRAVASARHFETVVICRREPFEAEIRAHEAVAGPVAGLEWAFLGQSWPERVLARVPGGTWVGYNLWQRRAFRLARRLDAAAPFDLVHHVNWVSFREPGYGWRLGRPFVLGPLGGTQNTPRRFLLSGGLAMALRESLRSVLNVVQLAAGRRLRRAARTAAPFLAANSTVQRDVRHWLGVESVRMLETGSGAVGAPRRWADRQPGPVRLLWVGDCLNRKGAHLMIRAMQRAERERPGAVVLRVFGDGPERAAFARLPGVEAPGAIPHAAMQAAYAEADALVFTSLRDTSGNVVLEALGQGLPVVCLDHQGVRDIVTPACGIKVPVTTPRAAVAGLAAGILAVGSDAEVYDRMSVAAVRRARYYSWERSSEMLRRIYLAALGLGPPVVAPPGTDALDLLDAEAPLFGDGCAAGIAAPRDVP
jgi:glycosyltransferase involved in cell wall biosynthesis